ncbi:MAG: heme o synthase [Halolamina sp.]
MIDSRPNRLPAMLAAGSMGVYLLIAAGATTAVTEAGQACRGFPLCGDGFVLPSTALSWLAVGHRLVAVAVGLLLVAAGVVAYRTTVQRRVGAALAVALALYPAQAALGAAVAVDPEPSLLSGVHLGVGLTIFAGLVAALGWRLEAETGDPSDEPTDPPTRDLPPEPDEPDADLPSGTLDRTLLTAKAYVRLTKPRLMWLLCLVASAAMALAGGAGLTPSVVARTLVAGSLAIGASGTFNHVLERDVDRRMNRTSDRPLATNVVPLANAVAFGVVLAAVSVGLFASVNPLSAVLGLAAILFYSVVYTLLLKPNTVQNTVLGGAAGALPALIGWAAVTGEVGFGGLALAALVFLWTPAHFYNLALAYKDDYERGGFPMMPVVRGETATRRHILWYLAATLGATVVLATLPGLDLLFVASGVALGAVFLWAVVRLHYERDEPAAFRSFHASNAYLGIVLLAIVVDTLAL